MLRRGAPPARRLADEPGADCACRRQRRRRLEQRLRRLGGPDGSGLTAARQQQQLQLEQLAVLSSSTASSGSRADGACPHASSGHGSGEGVDTLYIELMGVAVILVTVAIELATHKLEHMTEEYQHIHEMVQLVYKELMLLGLISFMLFLIELWSCLSPAIAHNLHTIHLLLFLLSMAYILEAVFILCISEVVRR